MISNLGLSHERLIGGVGGVLVYDTQLDQLTLDPIKGPSYLILGNCTYEVLKVIFQGFRKQKEPDAFITLEGEELSILLVREDLLNGNRLTVRFYPKDSLPKVDREIKALLPDKSRVVCFFDVALIESILFSSDTLEPQ